MVRAHLKWTLMLFSLTCTFGYITLLMHLFLKCILLFHFNYIDCTGSAPAVFKSAMQKDLLELKE